MNAKKNQIELDLDEPESTTTAKQRFYDALVALKSQEGEDGHTAEQIAKTVRATGFRATRVQARSALKNLVSEKHATSKTIAGRHRYFLGANPYRHHREQGVSIEVLRALKALTSRRAPHSAGCTNAQLHGFMAGNGSKLTLGQISRATSRCQALKIIGMTSMSGAHGHRTDVFRWTGHPTAEALVGGTVSTKPAPPEPLKMPRPRKVVVASITTAPQAIQQLKMLAEQTRHLIGKALMSREIPPTARNEAFAVTDAFDALVGKL
jgi:hypothetical protein